MCEYVSSVLDSSWHSLSTVEYELSNPGGLLLMERSRGHASRRFISIHFVVVKHRKTKNKLGVPFYNSTIVKSNIKPYITDN